MLDFKCPVCGGEVRPELSIGANFVSLDFVCDLCGRFADVDITPEAVKAKEEAMDYFNECAEETLEDCAGRGSDLTALGYSCLAKRIREILGVES